MSPVSVSGSLFCHSFSQQPESPVDVGNRRCQNAGPWVYIAWMSARAIASATVSFQINAMSTADEFSPQKYEDTVRVQLHAMIDAKVNGQDVMLSPAQEPKGPVVDLMAALKASLSIGTPEAVPEKEAQA
ncbi:MAG: hypothetical protein ACI9OJ_000921, partial [Myxococcota bacterium]